MHVDHGASLESYRSSYPLTIDKFLQLAILITEAVHGLHNKNEIIGVLTPLNININLSSQPSSAQLTDLITWNIAYRAPEYDHRLKSSPSQQSDLYSLGMIFYEMLAGEVPYEISDQDSDWYHTHLLKSPHSLIKLRNDLPEMIERIVFKLISKAPKDRYTSAYGVLHDLQKCYSDFATQDGIQPFQLGLRDRRGMSELQHVFNARDEELRKLVLCYEQVKVNQAKNMIVNVSGAKGTGKTELVRQFLSRLTDEVIIIGTSLNRNHSGDSFIVNAIRNGFSQLWFQDKKKILSVKDKIERECGEHISYIWTLFPIESERLELYPQKMQDDLSHHTQLEIVLHVLIKSFTLLHIPILIVMDDLQLADELSHNVMKSLISDKELAHTMIIGITENEHNPYTEHVLRLSQSSIIENERIVHLQLQNFSYEEVLNYLQALVQQDSKPMRLLARIAYDVSKGNPLQLKELVLQWFQSNRLRFNEEQAAWMWDEIIEDKSYHLQSDSLYLYKDTYKRLNEEVKTLLHIAAVIGMRFNSDQLYALYPQSSRSLIRLLEQAEREGMICREDVKTSGQNDAVEYLFLHTQLQLLIYEEFANEAVAWHYKIGALYWESYKAFQRIQDSIGAAKHWNQALPYLSEDEKEALLQLNVMNAKHYNWIRKHQEAVIAAEAGIALMDNMNQPIQQKFDYYVAAAIGEHMLGNSKKSYAYLQFLMGHYELLQQQDRIQLLLKQLEIYTFADNDEAYRIGQAGLVEIGWIVPEKVSPMLMLKEVLRTQLLLRKYRNEQHLPAINNEDEYVALNQLLIGVLVSTANVDPIKMLYILARYVQYGLKQGLTELLIAAIAGYELIIAREISFLQQWLPSNVFPKVEQAFARSGLPSYRILIIKGLVIQLENPEQAYGYWLRALRRCIENKDIVSANLALTFLLSSYYGNIHQLRELHHYLEGEASEYVDEKSKVLLEISKAYVLALGDEKLARAYIADNSIEESQLWYMLNSSYRMEISYLLGDYQQAIVWADRALAKVGKLDPLHAYHIQLFKGLSAAALYRSASLTEQKNIRLIVKKLVTAMSGWKGQWGKNSYAHMLIKAEHLRMRGKEQEAFAYYQSTIKQAQHERSHLIEGIANERLFDYMLAWGGQDQAAMSLMDACTAYASWGITTKMDWLRNQYPHIQWYYTKLSDGQVITNIIEDNAQAAHPMRMEEEGAATDTKHAATELAVSNASLPQEEDIWGIIGNSLNTMPSYGIQAFLELIVKQLGGTRICLINVKEDGYTLEHVVGRPINNELAQSMPNAIIRYVLNTKQPYIVEDAADNLMLDDSYIKYYQPRSIICIPFGRIRSENLKLLYMENGEISSQFTERTLQLLELFITRYMYLNWLSEKDHQEQAEMKDAPYSVTNEHSQSIGLVEPLTQREQEMLMYIYEGFTNKEIAQALQISEATVKTHITNLYGKLGVRRRSQAILRAQELNLLSPKS